MNWQAPAAAQGQQSLVAVPGQGVIDQLSAFQTLPNLVLVPLLKLGMAPRAFMLLDTGVARVRHLIVAFHFCFAGVECGAALLPGHFGVNWCFSSFLPD